MSGFTDVSEPVDLLKKPSDEPEEFSQGTIIDIFNDVSDLLSPVWYVTEAIDLVFGFNPLEEVLDWFSGDWESFVRCAEVWSNLGKATEAMAANIKAGNAELDASWNGNAGDSAYVYFDELAKKLDAQKASYDKLHEAYTQMAHSVYLTAEAINGFVGGILDGLIIVGLDLAAGTLTSWTGVGAAVGYGLAALEILNILREWGMATKAFVAAQQIVQAGVGTIEGLATDLADAFKSFPVPNGSYEHPNAAIE